MLSFARAAANGFHMPPQLEALSVAEYARLETALGMTVRESGGIHWVRPRPFFWRPLLPYEPFPLAPANRPPGWGGWQQVVREPATANATMAFLMLEQPAEYSLEGVTHNRRRLIRGAGRKLTVRPLRDARQFHTEGYAAYVSFYQRTRYGHLESRRRGEHFARWADTLLAEPKALILGAFAEDTLRAVSVAYWVGATLLYATHFTDGEALRWGATELLFHSLREAAAAQPGIRRVYVRRYQGGNSMDQYYQMRGAELVRLPARLELPPALRWPLRLLRPRWYARLRGTP